MASDEHQQLAQYLKNVHSSLRKMSSNVGVEKAWVDHCKNTEVLKKYAQCMEKLATEHWEQSSNNGNCQAFSRIKWSSDFCYDYFLNLLSIFNEKELEISKKIKLIVNTEVSFCKPYKLLDVGSCYNPFKKYDFLDVLAIDLCPANNSVKQCDFLNVFLGNETKIINNEVTQLEENSFDVITFCFLLEYIPSSELRIKACDNSYKLLKAGGLLIINTPDSKHVGANCRLMKCWRYALAILGFSRIKYEKFKHMHCMAYRKAFNKKVPMRWATLHKEPYMDLKIEIPQDFINNKREVDNPIKVGVNVEDFEELPFNQNIINN